MIVRFWGVRGSSPTPLAPEEIRNRIASIIQRIHASDLQNAETRQMFLTKLPPELFGTLGGNTACIEVLTKGGTTLIFDTGTGLRELEKEVKKFRKEITEYHVFLSHFHYDHLMGLPYFGAMYDSRMKVTFYSPFPYLERNLAAFMRVPYHPVGWDSFVADIDFHLLKKGEVVQFGDSEIHWIKRNHPNGCISYKVSEGDHSFIYSTDTELTEQDFQRTDANISYFQGADAIVHDTQYTLGEAIEKYNWGHSSYSLAVEFAREFDIRKLYLFHHDPMNNDSVMEGILQSAQRLDTRLGHRDGKSLVIDLAREGHTFEL